MEGSDDPATRGLSIEVYYGVRGFQDLGFDFHGFEEFQRALRHSHNTMGTRTDNQELRLCRDDIL